ncbi:MAG: DNA polymerase III subunit beta [Deltaproteobacteria bacterium]|nr:DNA polymerase III subunit beta [Deltaproteobacteria bacterium]
MEFAIHTSELTKGLYRAQGIVEKKTAMPILSNVLVEAFADGKISITATDLEVGMTGKHAAEVISAGSITIPARHLYDIVRSLPKGLVSLKKMPNNWTEVHCENIEYKMLGMAPEDFQALPDISKASLFKVDRDRLKEMIDKTSYAVSNDETRYNLNGAFLEMTGDIRFRMVATDGHRLSMLDGDLVESKTEFGDGVIIPRKGLMEIKRLIESEDGECKLGLDGSNLVFSMDEVTVVMRLLDGQFPEYRHVVPDKQKIKLQLDRKSFLDSLRRISILSSDRSLGVKFILSSGKLIVTTSNPDLGEAKEEIGIEYDGGEVTIGFNARYLIDALSNIDSERVDLSLEDDLSPGVLRPADDELYTCVVMPMRI